MPLLRRSTFVFAKDDEAPYKHCESQRARMFHLPGEVAW